MIDNPFNPHWGAAFYVANAITASAPAAFPSQAAQVVLYNTSTTAVAYFRCTRLALSTDAGVSAVIPTTAQAPAVGDFAIPPATQIRITVGAGFKKFSVIASAADGNLIITPGNGN